MVHRVQGIQSFIIEGNIGAGKSTFLRLIQEQLPVQVVYEPLDQWQQVTADQNLLDHFYKDTKRWAYTFQSYAFITRIIQQQKKALETFYPTQLLERSIYSDRYCFAKNCFEMGTMSPLEWALYQQWFDWLAAQCSIQPQGFIYLRTNPEVCFTRLKKRARTEEEVIPLSYLQSLHKKHEEWLVERAMQEAYVQEVPILVLEADQEFETNPVRMDEYLQEIASFMGLQTPLVASVKDQMALPT